MAGGRKTRMGMLLALLLTACLGSGCAMIGNLINTAFSLVPLLLFVTIEDPAENGRKVAVHVRLDGEPDALIADFHGEPLRVRASDTVLDPEGVSTSLFIVVGEHAGEQRTWSGRLRFPYEVPVETNILAGVRMAGKVSRPPSPSDRG